MSYLYVYIVLYIYTVLYTVLTVPRERGDPSPSLPERESERCQRAAALTQWGGVECDSGQTPSGIRAAPRERGRPEAANRGGKQRRCSSPGAAQQFAQAGQAGKATGRVQSPSWLLK